MDTAIETPDSTSTATAEEQAQEEIAREMALIADYQQGLPRMSIAALLMPPIWGPANGIWLTILWYPLWIFADNCLFAWWSLGTPLATVVGAVSLILLVAATIAFAYFSTPYAALMAIRKGKSKESYQRSERILTVLSIVLAVLFLSLASYYNLAIRPPLAG